MRLRLLVRRHNLPDAAVLWSVEDGENPTISQLLDQVNEVIPLESAGDWGLEDYAVEIGGSGRNFECLHFHLVRNILHEDDEILIRPLLSHDLKLRKASGRHQISSDGRHLFDGWVFGRPRPHGPVERPAIEIPPRKRRRITYLEESDSSFDESPFTIEGHTQLGSDSDGNRQLILSADFEDNEEDDDEDFEPNEDSEEDDEEGEEGGGLQHLNGHMSSLRDLSAMDSFGDEPDSEHMAGNMQKGSMSNLLRLCEEFPEAPRLVCDNVLVSCNDDIRKARDTLLQAFERSSPRRAMASSVPGQVPRRTINTRSKTKLPSKYKESSLVSEKMQNINDDDGKKSPHDEDTLLLQYYDHHGLPEGSIKTGKALSYMAKIVSSSDTGLSDKGSLRASRTKAASVTNTSTRTVRFLEDVSGGDAPTTPVQEDSEESEDEDFDPESSIVEPDISSDSSSAESSDDEETNKEFPDETSSSEGDSSSDSETTSESDSDSDSDAEPDEISSKTTVLQADAAPEGHSTTESPKEQKTLQTVLVPPGQGKNSTRNRNRRRRMANLLQRYQNKGILPAGTTIKELEQFKLDKLGKAENRTEKSGELNGKDAANDTEFEIRRQMLLNSLATGGVEVGPQPLLKSTAPVSLGPMLEQTKMSVTIEAIESETHLNLSKSKGTNSIDDRNAEGDAESYAPAKGSGLVEYLGQSPTADAEPTTAEVAPRPRRKIDLGAAGRLLFGALGVRAPKNKGDHEKVRNELVKDIRRSKPSTEVEEATAEIDGSNIDEDPEAWREVINLRAVECCYEGVELSPAPFPFIQRWDPQQQGNYFKQGSRGGKGKRNQRNQHQYYEDGQQSPNKRKRHESSYETYQDSHNQYAIADSAGVADTGAHNEGGEFISSSTSNMQEVFGDGIEGAVDEQIMRDVQEAATSQTIDEDDLPRLPHDISILPNLSDEAIKPGMVIAFKQLILSEATKWQPQMSNYRTAVLIKASESGNLELRLAKRDREQIEKYYDEETGERIYGKFDMPNEDDQDEDEENGFLEVTIDEIVEPKVVQLAPEGLDASALLPDLHNSTTQNPGDNSISPINTDDSELSKNLPNAPSGVGHMTTGHQVIGTSKDHLRTTWRDLSTGPDDLEAFPILENTRAENTISINDAGSRTSTPSSVNEPCAQISTSTGSASENRGYSPKFNGFNHISRQHAPVTSSPSHLDPTTPLTEHSYEMSVTKNDPPHIKSATPKVHYPELSVPSSLASQVSDRGHQPDYPIPSDDTLHQFDELDSFSGAQEELLLSTSEHAQASRSSNVEDKLPPNYSRSVSDDSSADLPTLAEVFSTARSSIGLKHEQQPLFPQKTEIKDAKKIQESYDKEMEALDAMLEAVEDSEHVTLNASVEQGTAKSQIENGSQFSIPPGSQKVDLTLSSDGEMVAEDNHSDEPYDDTCSPLRESERVEGKTYKKRRQRNNNSQTPSQRVAKLRNTRRKK